MTNFAVFWDYENIELGKNTFKLQSIQTFFDRIDGRMILAKSYSDWTRTPNHLLSLGNSMFELIMIPHGVHKKNAVDIKISVDIMNTIILYPHITDYYIISHDGDYKSSLQALRSHGKMTHLICNPKKVSDQIKYLIDSQISYLEFEEIEIKQKLKNNTDNLFIILKQAITLTLDNYKTDEVQFNYIINNLNKIASNFENDVKSSIEFTSEEYRRWFISFLKIAGKLNIINIRALNNSYMISLPQYEIDQEIQNKKVIFTKYLIQLLKKYKIQNLSTLGSLLYDKYKEGDIQFTYSELGYKNLKNYFFDNQDIFNIEKDIDNHWSVNLKN